jgi:hypothetical protein
MAKPFWATDRIQVDVSGFFTTHHRFQAGAGELGVLTLPASRREGVLRFADGRKLTVARVKWWRREHELREGGMTLAHAQPGGFFRREIIVQFGGWEYVLEPLGFFKRGWRLVDQSGMTLLEVHPQGFFKRGAFLEILDEIDIDLLVFGYYLVYVRWQEETAAAAAAAS